MRYESRLRRKMHISGCPCASLIHEAHKDPNRKHKDRPFWVRAFWPIFDFSGPGKPRWAFNPRESFQRCRSCRGAVLHTSNLVSSASTIRLSCSQLTTQAPLHCINTLWYCLICSNISLLCCCSSWLLLLLLYSLLLVVLFRVIRADNAKLA